MPIEADSASSFAASGWPMSRRISASGSGLEAKRV